MAVAASSGYAPPASGHKGSTPCCPQREYPLLPAAHRRPHKRGDKPTLAAPCAFNLRVARNPRATRALTLPAP